MKITRNTPDQLIIESKPWLIGVMILLFILIFVAVGLAMIANGEWMGLFFVVLGGGLGVLAFWAFVRRMQVIFHLPKRYVELRRKPIFSMTRVRHDLGEVSRAIIEESRSSKGAILQRVTLEFDSGQSRGRHPLTEAYSNIGNPSAIADTINAWLDSARARD